MFTKNNSSKNKQSKLFILVNCLEGKDDVVFDKIKKMNSVTDVQKTVGVFDLIVTLEVDSIDGLKKTQTHKIRTIDDVKYTMTLSTSSNNEVIC
jgi:DNA-binding Lrp family transcriptional regulator